VSVDAGVNHVRNRLPGGEVEIVFPVLVPRQQVTLSYLYFAPITFNLINMPVTSGFFVPHRRNISLNKSLGGMTTM
jgi:hypothetical protein